MLSATFPQTVYERIPLQVPEEAAGSQWFNQAVTFLDIDLGASYRRLLLQWMEMESRKRWISSLRHFKASQRPKELKKWVESGRYRSTITILPNDVPRFGKSVWKWWKSLQPAWRGVDSQTERPEHVNQMGNEWSTLDFSGPNGWLGILVCIRWWGEAVHGLKQDKRDRLMADWLALVEDTSLMLGGYLSYLSHTETATSI